VMGKHSGRNAFQTRLEELGITFETEQELNDVFVRFKELADRKHEIYDEDLQSLVTDNNNQRVENDIYRLVSLKTAMETGEPSKANVVLWVRGEELSASANGCGLVDATFKAIESLVDSGTCLELYSVSNVTNGTDSLGETTVRLEKGGRIVNGMGSDTDIVLASAKAYVTALNKIADELVKDHPQASV
ncbi:MAG: 2-isopropylmalate synthase, partial [Thiomicrorhabdus sp.]|nr:2-isopropylmalate synthase [Thiomicrorhabdus sp.]